MLGKVKFSELCLYGIFAVMIFWDVMDNIFPYSQYIALVFLLLMYSKKKTIRVNNAFCVITAIVLLHGVMNVIWGNDTIALLLKQIGAITVCYVVFYNILHDFSIVSIFNAYFDFALFVCIAGIVMQACDTLNGTFYYRMMAFYNEPSFLCYFLSPVVCLIVFNCTMPGYVDNDCIIKKKKMASCIILLVYLLTFSTIAYVGLLFMVIMALIQKGVNVRKVLLIILFFIGIFLAYLCVPDITMRVQETLDAFLRGNYVDSNLSTYTFFNNYNVTLKSVVDTFGLGGGLGSYQKFFDKFTFKSNDVTSPLFFLNREDANSAFFRLSAEFGVAGIAYLLWWLKHNLINEKSKYTSYSCAILVLFLLFLIRQGNYVHGGSIVYLVIFKKINQEHNSYLKRVRSRHCQREVLSLKTTA